MRISDWSSDVCSADLLASAPAAAQERAHDGGYEYAAAGWRGSLDVSTAGDGMTYFAIETRKDGMRCNLFGAGRLSEDTITLGAPRGTGSLILRFFDENAGIATYGQRRTSGGEGKGG